MNRVEVVFRVVGEPDRIYETLTEDEQGRLIDNAGDVFASLAEANTDAGRILGRGLVDVLMETRASVDV